MVHVCIGHAIICVLVPPIIEKPEFHQFHETCLNRTFSGPTFQFRIDRCVIYIHMYVLDMQLSVYSLHFHLILLHNREY
jgi:hypothetical protein